MQEDEKPDGMRKFEEMLDKADGGEALILLSFLAIAFGGRQDITSAKPTSIGFKGGEE